MNYLDVFGRQGDYGTSKVLEIFLEKDVYWYFPVALPPPSFSQAQEFHLVRWQHDPAVVIKRSDLVVLVLHYAHVFQIALAYQGQERELGL